MDEMVVMQAVDVLSRGKLGVLKRFEDSMLYVHILSPRCVGYHHVTA
jgi:hypothetical protein